MEEVKRAAAGLFATRPYHEITLTTIADELDWSRANLYKYVSTKEEIFLELAADARRALFSAFRAAFADGSYSPATVAEVWAGILNAHRDYLRYCDLLLSVIETNVSVERLAAFKRAYYEDERGVLELLSSMLDIPLADATELFYDVHYHAVGLCTSCEKSPRVREALELIGREVPADTFRASMQRFITMCLGFYCK